jgi:hypothetical protein
MVTHGGEVVSCANTDISHYKERHLGPGYKALYVLFHKYWVCTFRCCYQRPHGTGIVEHILRAFARSKLHDKLARKESPAPTLPAPYYFLNSNRFITRFSMLNLPVPSTDRLVNGLFGKKISVMSFSPLL